MSARGQSTDQSPPSPRGLSAEHDPAELEGAVEVGRSRDAHRPEIAEELRLDARGHSEAGNHQNGGDVRARRVSQRPTGLV